MPRVKTFFIFLLLILLLASSSYQAGRTQTGKEPAYLVAKMNSRKALLETTLDYDYGGANPKHDPKKGKPGIGGKP